MSEDENLISSDENEDSFLRAKSFMEGYIVSKNMLKMNKFAKSQCGFGNGNDEDFEDEFFTSESDECFWRAKMFAVRKFILSVESPACKQFLYYHYIKGETVEHCAELMGISRRSAFRIKRKALEYIAKSKYAAPVRTANF